MCARGGIAGRRSPAMGSVYCRMKQERERIGKVISRAVAADGRSGLRTNRIINMNIFNMLHILVRH